MAFGALVRSISRALPHSDLFGDSGDARLRRTMPALGAVIGALVWLGLGHSAWAQADRILSSDGAVLSQPRARPGAVFPSYAGSGRELAVGEVDDALANIKSRPETAEEVWALWSARPMTAAPGIETIIGADGRRRISPTTTYPARATVLIQFKTATGNSRCTGWMVGGNTVITAGHCVAKGKIGTFYNRATYKIYPGRNGAASPYGSCTAKRLYSVAGWVNRGLEEHDVGAIKLNCMIGNVTGWYGFFDTSVNIVGQRIAMQGYPGDKPLTQWRAPGTIRADSYRQIFYDADTVAGQSGSPVWQNRSASCRACAMAIHTNGLHGSPPHGDNNHGLRINGPVSGLLITWRQLP